MHRPAWWRFLAKPGQRLIAVFAVFVLLPGVVLGVFALRTLRQDKLIARQEILQRLENIAGQAGLNLARELRLWQEALPVVAMQKAADARSLPEMVRQAVMVPGAGLVVWLDGQTLGAFPSGQLLYLPMNTKAPGAQSTPVPSSVARVEFVELVRKDYSSAIGLYQGLLDSGTAESRPLILHRLARTFRKAGRLDDAVRTYLELERSAEADAGQLPWDLVARSEVCSIAADRGRADELATVVAAFCRDLAGGKWLLEKPRYLYYSDRCRSWSRQSPERADELRQLDALEETKLALTQAVEELLAEPQEALQADSGVYFASWQPDPFAAIVLSKGFLDSHLWPHVTPTAEDQDLAASLHSADGKVVMGVPAEGTPPLAVLHTIRVGDSVWRLQVWARDPAALYADLNKRQTLYMGMLIVVVALLVFGSYVTTRTVKREVQIARMRADFVSTVSHEFRSPLTGIRQLGEMLLDGRVRGEDKQRRYYGMIVQESERLGRLVENVLDFSRMEEGRKQYRLGPLDPSVWLREVVDGFSSEVAGNGVSIAASIPDGLPRISADGEALGCAVHNLLDNAVKYSPGSKTVWLDAHEEDGGIRISIRDRGVGISEQDQDRIFDKFYRVDGQISQRVKGAGLGLSLVQHIVTAHGGTVECESRVGDGSTFSIRLPVPPAAAGG